MNRTLAQWIDAFNRRVPEGFMRVEDFALFYLPEKGFCELGDTGKQIFVHQACGDFDYWRQVLEWYAKQLGRTRAGAFTPRNIKAFLRRGGYQIERVEQTAQGERYFCKHKQSQKDLVASPVDDGKYMATWEV